MSDSGRARMMEKRMSVREEERKRRGVNRCEATSALLILDERKTG
jgi:hypothetical protein